MRILSSQDKFEGTYFRWDENTKQLDTIGVNFKFGYYKDHDSENAERQMIDGLLSNALNVVIETNAEIPFKPKDKITIDEQQYRIRIAKPIKYGSNLSSRFVKNRWRITLR